jgi:transposase-like protein
MSISPRRVHDAQFKTKVVLEALKGVKTLAQLSSEFGIHAQMITDWKRQVLEGLPTLFESGATKSVLTAEQREQIEAPLFQQIGQLKVENDWLKKKLRTS